MYKKNPVQNSPETRLIKVYYPIRYTKNKYIAKQTKKKQKNTFESYSGLCQTSKTEPFVKTVNGFQQLTIFAKKLHPRCLTGS